MSRVTLLLALCALTLAPATARAEWRWNKKELKEVEAVEQKVAKSGERWTVEGRHWAVESDVSQRFTAELSVFMDLFRDTFFELVGGLGEPKVKQKPTVVVFRNEADYEALFTFKTGARGKYRYKWDGGGNFTEFHLYSFVKWDRETEFGNFYHPILQHEGTHVLLRALLDKADCPKWFDEGLATYFQFWDLRQDLKSNLKTRYSRSEFKKYLSKKDTPDLKALTEIHVLWNPDNMGPQAQRNYALGESVIDMLLSSKKGRLLFFQVFQRLLGGEDPFTPKELKKVEQAWHAHLARVAG